MAEVKGVNDKQKPSEETLIKKQEGGCMHMCMMIKSKFSMGIGHSLPRAKQTWNPNS